MRTFVRVFFSALAAITVVAVASEPASAWFFRHHHAHHAGVPAASSQGIYSDLILYFLGNLVDNGNKGGDGGGGGGGPPKTPKATEIEVPAEVTTSLNNIDQNLTSGLDKLEKLRLSSATKAIRELPKIERTAGGEGPPAIKGNEKVGAPKGNPKVGG